MHDVAATAERPDRHAATDDLAKRRQIGCHTIARLGPAKRDAKAGHYFVENQHCPVLGAKGAQRRQKLRVRRHQIHVAGDRFNDHRGDISSGSGEEAVELGDIVVGEHCGVRDRFRRNAG